MQLSARHLVLVSVSGVLWGSYLIPGENDIPVGILMIPYAVCFVAVLTLSPRVPR